MALTPKPSWSAFGASSLGGTAAWGGADYQRHIQIGRLAVAIFFINVLLGPLMTFADVGHENEGNVERQVAYFLALGLTIYAMLPLVTRKTVVAVSWPVLAALGWAWLTVIWAFDPGMAARRLVLTTLCVWMVFALVRHVGYQAVIDTLRIVMIGALIACYIAVLLFPDTGIQMMDDAVLATSLPGNWRGILGHKNFAGALAAICILLFLFDAKQIKPVVRIAVIVMAGYFLYRTQSKTSGGMLFLAIAGGYVFERMSNKFRAYFIPIAMMSGAVVWFMLNYYDGLITNVALNPAAFTGRGQIWNTLLRFASDHLMFGAGFGSFWNIGAASPVFKYGSGFVTEITIGHSGFLDQLAAVGLPGMLLMVFAVMIWPLFWLLSSKRVSPNRGALVATLLMFCIGHNITESSLFERDGIVAVFLYLAAALAQFGGVDETVGSAPSQSDLDLLKALRDRRAAASAP